jgi:predicted flavoprotein YhiN
VFEIVRGLGHIVHPLYPALTPLLAELRVHASLSGVSLNVRIRAKWRGSETESHGGFLFTHRGYSGPSVLDVSHVAVQSLAAGEERATLRVRWSELDREAWLTILDAHGGLVLSAVSRTLPGRLAELLLVESGIPLDRKARELRKTERNGLVDRLTSYDLPGAATRDSRKRKSPAGASRSMRSTHARSRAAAAPACSCAARSSTPSDRSAVTTSRGRGDGTTRWHGCRNSQLTTRNLQLRTRE